jgi:hypothetical protein
MVGELGLLTAQKTQKWPFTVQKKGSTTFTANNSCYAYLCIYRQVWERR